MTSPRHILITGGAGNIATHLAESLVGQARLTLLDLPGTFTKRHREYGRVVEANVADLESFAAEFAGVDTVIHLGGERRPGAAWSTLLPANIVGTYNVVAAAIAHEVRHVVYASSVHAVSGYPLSEQVRESDPVRPADLYGVTKCFGEALGAYVADSRGMAFTALRIGAFQPPSKMSEPDSGWAMRDFVAIEDLLQILHKVIAAPNGFQIYNAVSGNTLSRLSIEKARTGLGFEPQYDAFALSDPYREAGEKVGGLADLEFPSGMRDEIDSVLAHSRG